MDTLPRPEQPNLSLQLLKDGYYQLIHTLRATLTPVSDAPEDLVRRDNAAIAQVAALLPTNADEANIAAQYVAASAYALDCLRLAREYAGTDPAFSLTCGGHAGNMMRQARGARSLLLRVQAARQKLEANSVSADRAAWTEHCATVLMAEALGHPVPEAMEEPPQAPPPEEEPQPEAEKLSGLAAEAEFYAIVYPKRAALIRAEGGLPAKLDFDPLSPELVDAIVTGRSPALLALDEARAA